MAIIDQDGYTHNTPMFMRARIQKCATPGCSNTYVGMPGTHCTTCIAESISQGVIAIRHILQESEKTEGEIKCV